MNDSKTPKKALWKRILKWTGLSFFLLVLFALLVPFLFKDKIIQLIKDQANANLNATIDFGDVDLTFLSTFPNLTLSINDLSVIGKDDFSAVRLAQISETHVTLDFWKIFAGTYEIESFKLVKPNLYVLVLPDGKANYDIAISDSTTVEEELESSPFKFAVQSYAIEGGNIVYDDQYFLTYINIDNLNHKGALDIDDIIYNLSTHSSIDHLTFGYDGVNYINNTVSDIACDIEIAMPDNEMKFTFKENTAVLNQLGLHFDGWFLMNDELMDMDISFSTVENSFKSLLSLVPGAYTSDFDQIKTDGTIQFDGTIKGIYDDINMPGFDLNLVVDNAWFQYPGLPEKVKNIDIRMNTNREAGPDLDNLVVDIDHFSLEFLQNKVDVALKLNNIMSDPAVDSRIQAFINLAELNKAFPLGEGEQYSGTITSDITLKGKVSAIEKEHYEEFDAKGDLKVMQMKYESPETGYTTAIDSMLFKFSPQALGLNYFEAKIGKSDISVNGSLNNYIAYFLRNETIEGKLKVSSTYLDLDELMGTEQTSTTSEEVEATENPTSSSGLFMLPTNVDFTLESNFKTVRYDGMDLKNMGGNIRLKEGKATAEKLRMDLFDGTILMNAGYFAHSINDADVSFDYDIKNLDIPSAYKFFNTIEKYAPIAKYCEGKFSTVLSLTTKINGNYEPLYETITGNGVVKTNKVTLKEVPVFTKIADLVKIPGLKEQTLTNMDISFEFKEGKVWMKETPLKMGTINGKISGTTSFKQELDYIMELQIPQKAFGNNATSIITGLLGNVSAQTGLAVSIPDIIPVKVKIGGTSTNPIITTDLKDQGKEAATGLMDQGIQLAKEKLSEEAKKILAEAQAQADKILAEAKIQADKVRAEAEIQAKKIEDEGKKSADKIRSEAQKQAEKIKEEEYKAAQALIDQASNPVAKKGAEKLAEEARKKTDQKIADLVAKSNTEAGKVEQTAKQSADKVRNEANEKATGIENTGKTQADNVLKTANDKVDKMTE
jgi:vacuolar-type H+-ATPase subunit H